MNLTEHFTLEELCVTQTGLDNTPDEETIDRLGDLANLLEEVRDVLGTPIKVSSGFRSPPVNKAVKGSARSAHLFGLAADFTSPEFGRPIDICKAILDAGIQFDQLVHEYGRWVHIGLSVDGYCRQHILTIDNNGTREGLHPVK